MITRGKKPTIRLLLSAGSAAIALAFFSPLTVNANPAPSITTQPQSQSLETGSNAVFQVVASGQTPLSYQWSFNGANLANSSHIGGATSATLTVSNITVNDAGPYRVVVSNSHGSATSTNATLTVLVPAAITNEPSSQIVYFGGPASFSVSAIGTAPLSYQWYFNSEPLSDNGQVSGSATAVLNLSAVSSGDIGNYQVIVTNLYGVAASTTVTLSATNLIHYVNISNPTPSPPYGTWNTAATNIQDAIDVSVSGDQIFVTNGIYSSGDGVVSGITNCVTATNAISISSVSGPAQTIIDGGDTLRCVYLSDGCVFSGFTVTNGTSPGTAGGGIYCADQNVLITNCIITGNFGVYGAGVDQGTLIGCQLIGNQNGAANDSVMTNCVLFGNTGEGGAFFGTLFNCMIISNTSSGGAGGATYCTLTECTLIANTAYAYGGAAQNCTLFGCTVIGNSTAGQGGGGVYQCTVYNSLLSNNAALNETFGGGAYYSTLSNCVLTANSAGEYGGGADQCTLYSCTLSNNAAFDGGGAGNSTLYNCSLNGNNALYGGGAAFSTLTNCVVAENYGEYGSGGAFYSTLLNSLIESNTASVAGGVGGCVLTNCILSYNFANATGPAEGGGGAQDSSLYNCLLTYNSSETVGGGARGSVLINCTLALNTAVQDGGGVDTCDLTNSIIDPNYAAGNADYSGSNNMSWCCTQPLPHAGSGDFVIGVSNVDNEPLFVIPFSGNNFRLWPTSPCIDSGNNSVVPVTVDLDGNPRIVNGTVDMGAYEFQNTPFIEIQPAGQSVPLDDPSVSFSVTAVGPGLTYQWQFDGSNIAGATNSTFALDFVQYGEAGSYSVVVSNSYGTLTSSNAVLTVVPPTPPQFTEEPSNQIAVAGTNVIETALATGAPPAAYQWFFNGTPLSDGSHYIGSASNQLEILDVQTNDSGNYFVVATNAGGVAMSLSATVTVMVVPAITLNPASQVEPLGSSATFTAAASGSAPLTYQWTFNGNPLTDGGQFSGSATTNLTISNLQLTNIGNYVLTVSNAVGSAASLPAMLTVSAAPTITQQPSSQTVLPGQNAVFSAAATGTPTLNYQWYFDGNPLVNGGGVNGANTQTLYVNNVQTNDIGTYQLIVTNAYGSATSLAVALNIPAVIVSQPTNQSIVLSSNVTLSASATGSQPLTYQWYFQGIALTDGGRVSGSTTPSLSIVTVQTNDGGAYQLMVTNNYGSSTSAVATLTILVPAAITSEPANRAVLTGSNVTFSVSALGTTPLSYQWYSNGVALINGGPISGAASATLAISNAQTNNDGAYNVIVTNAYGSATSSVATLAVYAPVQITGQPMSQDVLLGSNATFTVVAGGTGPLGYQWYANGAPLTDGGGISGSATAALSITNVQSNDAEGYNVVVSNLLSSARSLTASLTPEAVIAPSVRYVMLSSTNPTAPYLNWSTAATNIQDAVDAAVAGDLVLVSNGTYNTGARLFYGTTSNRLVVNKPITVQSLNGPAATTIMGIYFPTTAHPSGRCAYLTNNAVLSGFTLDYGGTLPSGNAITNESGGGVWCESPSAVASNCVFTLNYAPYYGGGAFDGTLLNCSFTTNTAGFGGGAASSLLFNCTLSNNVGGVGNFVVGGGAYGSTLSNCLLVANRANTGGGAYGSVLYNCILMTNTAGEFGGGGYSNVMYNCILENNTAGQWGGAAYNSALYSCTVVSNTAPDGAGIYGGSATNCIIYYNYFRGTIANDLNSKAIAYTCIFPAIGFASITNPPIFVNLTGEDFHLQSNSPCINSGINAAVTTATDLDGNPRIVGGTVDMGAYEYQTPSSVISYAYLQQYGLPTDGSADYADLDGTPFNVYQDWVAGLNPTNPASVLAMLPTVTTNASGITVRWQSVSGISYNLQRSTNLLAQPPFSTIKTNISGLIGTTSYGDTTATNNVPYFYRVDVQKQ